MTKDRLSRVLAAAGAGVLALLLLSPLPYRLNTPMVRHVFDLGHLPLFAAVTILLHRLIASRHRLILAVAIASLLALAAEGGQRFVPTREPGVGDLLLDLAGTLFGAAAIWTHARRGIWRAAFAVLVAATIVAGARVTVDEWRILRGFDEQMPVIAGFEQEWELRRWNAKDATDIRRTDRRRTEGDFGLEVSGGDAPYTGVSVEDFDPDWTGYRWLAWDAIVPGDRPLELFVRIDDDQGEEWGTRYTTTVTMGPGAGRYRIDLDEVRTHFREHPMNMRAILELHFFLAAPASRGTWVLDHVRLER